MGRFFIHTHCGDLLSTFQPKYDILDKNERCAEGKEKNIPVQECLTSEEIGRRIGKSKKAIIGISDENFAKAIYKILSGGEAIG